jgi:hypothetical protein
VPASMRLLGDWNWYLPKWLRWLPQLNVEGTGQEPRLLLAPEVGPGAVRRSGRHEPVGR